MVLVCGTLALVLDLLDACCVCISSLVVLLCNIGSCLTVRVGVGFHSVQRLGSVPRVVFVILLVAFNDAM
jgi:hypothetical protein